MPKIYREVTKPVTQYVGFECSRCKRTFYSDNDLLETQECLSYRAVGTYGSVWGDGVVVEFDLCQKCLYDLTKDFATIYD